MLARIEQRNVKLCEHGRAAVESVFQKVFTDVGADLQLRLSFFFQEEKMNRGLKIFRASCMGTAANKAYETLAQCLSYAVSDRPADSQLRIAVCGGGTPKLVWPVLGQALEDTGLKKRAVFLPGDERQGENLSPEDFNLNTLREQLFAPLHVAPNQIRWCDTTDGLSAMADHFSAVGSQVDVNFAGIGGGDPEESDTAWGHFDSLFKHHPLVEDNVTTGYVSLTDSPKPPPERITLSRRTVTDTLVNVMMIRNGSNREMVLDRLIEGDCDYADCPALLLGRYTGSEQEGFLLIITDIQR